MLFKKKRVCFVATCDSAITVFLAQHLKQLSKFYDITVITNPSNPNFLSEIGVDVSLIHVNFSRKIALFADFYFLVQLVQIFIKNRFVCVHSITPKAGLLAMLAARICFIPTRIHTYTGQVWATEIGLKRSFLKLLDNLIGKMTTHNLVDSQSQRDFLLKEAVLSPNKSLVFGYGSVAGVDLKKFKSNKRLGIEMRKQLGIPKDGFVYLFLGRLVKDKGVLDLAKAFSEINNAKIYLVFVGSDEAKLSAHILNICAHKTKHIRVLGFSKEPHKYIASANVLCLPSYREGFGSVIIEAAAMGVPAIASNIYGITDAIQSNKTGLLHEPRDILGIKIAMESLLHKPLLLNKLKQAAKRRVVDNFDANKVTNDWLKFYSQHVS
jgi:glycosyltransferase involved in cell wall biosynthesis